MEKLGFSGKLNLIGVGKKKTLLMEKVGAEGLVQIAWGRGGLTPFSFFG